jgi:hypothetical protein
MYDAECLPHMGKTRGTGSTRTPLCCTPVEQKDMRSDPASLCCCSSELRIVLECFSLVQFFEAIVYRARSPNPSFLLEFGTRKKPFCRLRKAHSRKFRMPQYTWLTMQMFSMCGQMCRPQDSQATLDCTKPSCEVFIKERVQRDNACDFAEYNF